jgi:choice-of-anchor A domain-containing protein
MRGPLRQQDFLPLLIAVFSLTAHADSALFAASRYNVFVQDNYTLPSGDVQGAVAVGGILTLGAGGVSLATNLPVHDNAYDVVAGADFIAQGGGSSNGNLFDGTAGGISPNFTVGGTITDGPANDPIDFSTAFAKLRNLSTTLAAQSATNADGCTTNGYGTVTCTAAGAGLHVINVPYGTTPTNTVGAAVNSYDLAHNVGINFNIPAGVTLVINVAGANAQGLNFSGAGWNVNGDATKLLFNFSQATTLLLGPAGIHASLLAPLADVTVGGGNSWIGGDFHGNFIALNVTHGDTEFHNELFTGDLSQVEPSQALNATPEPAGAILFGAGFLVVALRKRYPRI